MAEKCANCEETIGNLEMPMVWHDQIVCTKCFERLSKSDAKEPEPNPFDELPPEEGNASSLFSNTGGTICSNPNCGYRGLPIMKSRTRPGVSIALILLWIAFGISGLAAGSFGLCLVAVSMLIAWLLYTVFTHGKAPHCPRCGVTIATV
jgi:hypothetical protein